MSDDDSSRRAEINAFAAMAAGDFDFSSTSNDNSGTFDSSALSKSANTISNSSVENSDNNNDSDPFLRHLRQAAQEDDNTSQPLSALEKGDSDSDNNNNDGDDNLRNSFAQAGQRVENSGTFSLLTPAVDGGKGRSSVSHRNHNLEAAALALADPSDQTNSHTLIDPSYPFKKSSSINSNNNVLQFPCGAAMSHPNINNPGLGPDCRQGETGVTSQTHGGKIPQNKTPMHVQEVRVSKPLFFGTNLPARVMKEARRNIDEAFEKQRREHEEEKGETFEKSSTLERYTPRIGQLSPEIRNLVSAIRCYGSGMNILPKEYVGDDGRIVNEKEKGYLSVFCPKWSEGCKNITSSSTAGVDKAPSIADNGNNNLDDGEQMKSLDKGGYDTIVTEMTVVDTSATKSALESNNSLCEPQNEDEPQQRQESDQSGTFLSLETNMSERDMFSAFARYGSDYSGLSFDNDDGDGDGDGGDDDDDDDSAIHLNTKSNDSPIINKQSDNITSGSFLNPESKMIRSSGVISEVNGDTNGSYVSSGGGDSSDNEPTLSEQALFTQWVHGGDSPFNTNNSNDLVAKFSDSFRDTSGGNNKSFFKSASGTFMNTIVSDDSDDDSVVGSEMKKKVGVNEHLNAALASLEEDHSPIEECVTDAAVEEADEMTQVPLTEDGGRVLSNQELMNGHAPLFGVDDPPLPSESDLGNHETREEQQRSKEQRRIQAFIEKLCPHNIFGPLACPNPALSPDDNHSWNSMSTPLQRKANTSTAVHSTDIPASTTSPMSRSVSSDDLASLHSVNGATKRMSSLTSHTKIYDPRTRYGWWNKSENDDDIELANRSDLPTGLHAALDESYVEEESTEAPIQLPPVEHAANACLIQTRLKPSPETLYKQNRPLSELHPATSSVQALPFLSDRPPSYRYLQVDTQAVAFPALGGEVEPLFCSLAIYHVETITHSLGDRGMAPTPDLQRCGKVTETLNFDVVNDTIVEKRCFASLSPYTSNKNNQLPHLTRCGVFPLPSNLSVYNLYAIITVSKVISEGSDFEPYLRAKSKGKEEKIDTEILRAKAEKASNNHGKFIMPFAFGVAPLLQVFGADVPHVPSSRAVQIPLFRFFAGNGERQIIDHIMVMLYPRADHRASGIGGPAPVTNGGTAMLVMRNFGYLGLHEVVNSKSSLARDRLVDFTGEMQLLRRDNEESDIELSAASKAPHDSANTIVPAWQSQYIAEPTKDGGRSNQVNSSNYAQELAPVPLLTAPLGRPNGTSLSVPKSRIRGHSSGEDIEPYFHTNFCNELLCHPRLLHNCQKGNIVVKVEMREIEWNSEYGAFFAHLPTFGPVVHNLRRGPFLVQDAYTSCSARCADPHFLDEFKMKLPLVLGKNESRSINIFFTVYRLSFSSRKKWGLRLLGRKRSSRKIDEITGDIVGESNVVASKDCQLIQLGCGFLPLEKEQSLLHNGNHDVKISYVAKYPLPDFCDKHKLSSETLIVSDFTVAKGDSGGGDDSITDDCESQSSDRYLVDTVSATSVSDRDTVLSENMEESKTKQQKKHAGMLLQVRISVQSSVHSQNATLNEFFSQEPDTSIPFLRLGKDEIVRHFSRSSLIVPSENIQYETKKLLISTVDLAKSDMCSVADISSHLLRVCKQLWKVAVVGTGNHDLEWSNPAAALPLRVNAFATLLQILGSSTVFLSKRGVTQLDGKSKWNFASLSRVMGLLFDEKEMFGDNYDEALSEDFLFVLSGSKEEKKPKNFRQRKNRRHVRSNFEFVHNGGEIGTGSDGLNAIICEDNLTSGEAPISSKRENDFSLSTRSSKLDKFTILDIPGIKQAGSPPLSTSELKERPNDKTQSESPKMDTVNDFRNALQTGSSEKDLDDDMYEGKYKINVAAASWIKAFGGSAGGASRRWMTAPAPGLSTIQEDDGDDGEQKSGYKVDARRNQGPLDSLDSEILLPTDAKAKSTSKRSVKQFRVPKLSSKSSPAKDGPSLDIFDNDSEGPFPPAIDIDQSLDLNTGVTLLSIDSPDEKNVQKERKKKRGQTLPTTDADMLEAGSSFLDAIEKSLGLGTSFSSNYPQEEEARVFGRHHRKTISHSSIDWSIPNDDLSNLLAGPANDKKHNLQEEPIENFDESMGTLSQENELILKLPSYSDRLATLGNSSVQNGRWFPYTYEVIIMQWAAILIEQQRSAIDLSKDGEKKNQIAEENDAISDAASRTSGAIIACAPVLFEVIKQSLGARVTCLIRRVTRKFHNGIPPLVTLDDDMLANLEQLIAMLTDACLDSRNFDSWETRQGCVDVNDSIVCFLRDMWSFLDPSCVYRLTMVYWSRLVARDGRQWQDRDSSIGLRCSWEITKLQMNAISAFVRFPDFIKVNSPQMNSWTNWQTSSPALLTVNFFDNTLDRYEKLGLPSILSDSTNQERIELPRMRPHWLAEIIVDICFSGIEHAEQNIQQRSASLLFELFWSHGQLSLREGYSPIVAAMYITFIEKVLSRTTYLSTCFTPKSQVRRNVILCVIFVLQSAPSGLLRALWRKLFTRSSGKGSLEKYGGMDESNGTETQTSNTEAERKEGPDIYDMFSLLNVCLTTVEYEGSDEHFEIDDIESDGPLGFWPKEFLMARELDTTDSARRRRLLSIVTTAPQTKEASSEDEYNTTSSRKWLSHDASIVLIRTAQQIVRELRFVLEPIEGSQSLFNPARRKAKIDKSHRYKSSSQPRNFKSRCPADDCLKFSYLDTIIFVRGATSVYLNSLVLRESDIALVKTLNASVEIIKIFGIRIFNEAVGETLQHWLRMITFHCGARRAEVRVPASDFAELILRSTWDCFGSFFRIRIPLLAVQTEVMERIVATSAARHYRDQRKTCIGIDLFSNSSAEASLTPLWRTTDRLHHQSASQNVAFRSSLVRLAEKLKKLHKAYIAAHALAYQNRSQSQDFMNGESNRDSEMTSDAETLRRANRISVIRVVNASAGYSKQFLGLQGASRENTTLAHHEALEDAFLDAADVFSPTELPDHRVAWLRKLAQFHATRSKNAEEATCHYMIYYTLNRSSRMSWSLWSSTPFLPWIDNLSDGIHLEGPTGDPDGNSICDLPELDYGRQIDKTNSFRRIFYRNENSVRLNAGELEAGTTKAAFYGVSLTSEYLTTTPWITPKEMEANMLEEAEAAGDLFQKSGVIASSRYMWSLAAQYYAEKFMYGKLTHVYERLARTVVSQVPHIDNTLEQAVNVGIPLGNFYRVWFHGGAPDELIGEEFVYRTRTNMTLSRFGKELRDVLRCIIPEKTPIHLVLDGRPEESVQPNPTGFIRVGGAPLEPVKVKVTPLRPVVRNASKIRGLPEWFELYIDSVFCSQTNPRRSLNDNSRMRTNDTDAYRENGGNHHYRSYSSSIYSSGKSTRAASSSGRNMGYSGNNQSHYQLESPMEGELVGADKFWFIQSMNRDRSRGPRDWLKGSSGDFAEKTLRVTQLQVRQAFPACISRQTVVHRVVYTQSPLEAAVDNMCLWCANLFRTSISSNGSAVLGVSNDPGIGIEAAKVVSECIHSSRVKEMGTSLLRKNNNVEEEDDDVLQSYDRLGEDEVQKFQLKLARSLVVFMELLHLLISRNRDLLLDVIQSRKKNEIGLLPGSKHARDVSLGLGREISIPGTHVPLTDRSRRGSEQPRRSSVSIEIPSSSTDGRSREDVPSKSRNISEDYSANTTVSLKDYSNERARTDSAIGIQRELQLAFINIAKELYPIIHGIMEIDTPRWLKQCCQDNYFSAYTYRQAKIPIGEELTFEDVNTSSIDDMKDSGGHANELRHPTGEKLGLFPNYRSDRSYLSQAPGSPGGSIGSSSVVSRGSDAGRSIKSTRSLRSLKERKPQQAGV